MQASSSVEILSSLHEIILAHFGYMIALVIEGKTGFEGLESSSEITSYIPR